MGYDLDDLQSDAGHLANLLEVIADHFIEQVKFVDEDGNRIPAIDKLNALVWIARDLGNGLVEKIDQHHQTIRTPRGPETQARQ